MPKTTPEQNKAIVLEAFDTLFNKRDYAAAERFWSPKYIQHSAHIAPGREGLFALVRSTPDTLRYENQVIVAEGDYVIAHGRFTGMGRPAAWIAADVVRFEDGLLAEHWDVLQDEATKKESVSGLPMFGDSFPCVKSLRPYATITLTQIGEIMNLTGNTIFITGGGSGIGRALAEELHKRGNKVIISGRRKSHLDAVAKANPGIEAIELDIADPDSIKAVAKKLIRRTSGSECSHQ